MILFSITLLPFAYSFPSSSLARRSRAPSPRPLRPRRRCGERLGAQGDRVLLAATWGIGRSGRGSVVLRGGSWNNTPRYCRSAFRDGLDPDDQNGSVGFRAARTL